MSDALSPSEGSPFWQFSLRFYRMPNVAEACIALQEESGVDVNVLLFLLWHAQQRRSLSAADVAALDARVAPWRDATVIPLRAVRRALKSPPTLVAPATAEAFRTRIKAVELEAERLQQEAMFRLAPLGAEGAKPEAAARTNVDAYQAALGARFSPPAVATLVGAFSSLLRPSGVP
jgi:uncharacterized protein (TIGR02444 family)